MSRKTMSRTRGRTEKSALSGFHQTYADGRSDLLSEAVLLPNYLESITSCLTARDQMPMTIGRSTITSDGISVVPGNKEGVDRSWFRGGPLRNLVI